MSQRKGRRQITPWQINDGNSWACKCSGCWMPPNRNWHPHQHLIRHNHHYHHCASWFSLTMDFRGHDVFGPCLASWYEQELTLLFVGGADWWPLSGYHRGGQYLTLMFVVRSNRLPLAVALRDSTYPSLWFTNPSSLDFWLGFFHSFDITKILIIFVSWGRGDKVLVSILFIDTTPVVITVTSIRGCPPRSLSVPWQQIEMLNSGRIASLSASQ